MLTGTATIFRMLDRLKRIRVGGLPTVVANHFTLTFGARKARYVRAFLTVYQTE